MKIIPELLLYINPKRIKNKARFYLSDWIISFSQVIFYFAFSRLLRYFFLANRKLSKTLRKLERGSLLVANHQSVLDPVIILAHLPFRIFLKVTPVRFPMSHEYFIWLRFLAILGAYDIGKNSRKRMLGLMRTRQYLIDGKSIMIFPEGHICSQETMLTFQKGITFLTDVSRKVLFVRMNGFHYRKWLKYGSINRNMVFGEVHDFRGELKDIDALRKHMEQISQ